MMVFEVHLEKGSDGGSLLSSEMIEETKAQVLTVAEAARVGFSGVPDDPQVRLVLVESNEARFVQAAIERAADVTGYQIHEVPT